jgi:hypothetical protein
VNVEEGAGRVVGGATVVTMAIEVGEGGGGKGLRGV